MNETQPQNRTTHPITIRGLDHVVLRARDAEALVAFYCDVLGCTLEKRQDDLGLIQVRAGASLIDFVTLDGPLGRNFPRAPAMDAPNMDHFCVAVAPWDADAILAHLKAHGVEPGDVAERYGADGTGPSIYLQDPEGNLVELKGPSTTGKTTDKTAG